MAQKYPVFDDIAPSAIKVGDTLHKFDENRRVYERVNGRATGAPIYAEHFSAHVIVGETARSWLLNMGHGQIVKVSKKDLHEAVPRFLGHQWYTAQGKIDHLWVKSHVHKLRDLLDRADAAKLRAIADILGYVAEGGAR
jgi:hypothetical protein